jgi:hypothetical protein
VSSGIWRRVAGDSASRRFIASYCLHIQLRYFETPSKTQRHPQNTWNRNKTALETTDFCFLCNGLYCTAGVVKMQATALDTRNGHWILVGKPVARNLLGRPRLRLFGVRCVGKLDVGVSVPGSYPDAGVLVCWLCSVVWILCCCKMNFRKNRLKLSGLSA